MNGGRPMVNAYELGDDGEEHIVYRPMTAAELDQHAADAAAMAALEPAGAPQAVDQSADAPAGIIGWPCLEVAGVICMHETCRPAGLSRATA